MTKLDDTLKARDECRARFLGFRKDHAQNVELCRKLEKQRVTLAEQVRREQGRLADLTAEVAQLLHADLAGVVGNGAIPDPAHDDQEHSPPPRHDPSLFSTSNEEAKGEV